MSKPHGSFEELETYKVARAFRIEVYKVARALPDSEKFVLNPQMRRAALSVTNNIAEGHGRFHYIDNIRFLLIARGSLEELMDDLNVCLDESYLPPTEVSKLKEHSGSVLRLINGYIRYLRDSKAGPHLGLQETPAPYGSTGDEDLPWLADFLALHPFTDH